MKTIRVTVALVTSTLAALAVQAQSAQTPVSQHLARNLAAQCANCHGTNGRSVADVRRWPARAPPSWSTR